MKKLLKPLCCKVEKGQGLTNEELKTQTELLQLLDVPEAARLFNALDRPAKRKNDDEAGGSQDGGRAKITRGQGRGRGRGRGEGDDST